VDKANDGDPGEVGDCESEGGAAPLLQMSMRLGRQRQEGR